MNHISDERIPNNVDLASDKKLQRALEQWQPQFIDWWKQMGPEGFQGDDIYLRTAISVEANGWAQFDYVKMPEYRWGIFLEPSDPNRTIHFGDNIGQPVWQDVPGEFRNLLRRLIVTQGDTEPASVEQQRRLGTTAPSMYDLRNLFQVNVEEGRHLWAMVYLLHRFFGRDGRDEAEELLARRSGDDDRPRILGAFNEPTRHWLSFFMFAHFVDRDGKYQLASLAESGFDPLARTCRFMLTEEAHHLFVGETGLGRVVERSVQLMKQDPNEDARAQGGVDLPTFQKYMNMWVSVAYDLFGGEISSNAADAFAAGLKGRYKESTRFEDHTGLGQTYRLDDMEGGKVVTKDVPYRTALNEVLRQDYYDDCVRALERWNKTIKDAGIAFELKLPSRRFNRSIGAFAGYFFSPDGTQIDQATFETKRDAWLPTQADDDYVAGLMQPSTAPGQIANWIAPPRKGINGQPFDFTYVKRVG
jgi:benzoyl-CoA 2,3-dioxygenase component B